MRFEEKAVGADGDRRAGQRLDHGAIAAGRCAQAAGLLHAMGGVEDHGHAQGLHLRNRAHVVDQPSIAEEAAALAQEDVPATGSLELADDVLHVPGGEELAFLDVYRPAGAGRRHEQIGLPGQKGGDLQEIADLGRGRRLFRKMDVRGHRQAGRLLHAGEDGQTFAHARTAIRVDARAVGLVERGLEDQRQGKLVGDLLQACGDRQRQFLGFDDAGAGNHQQRLPPAAVVRSDRDRIQVAAFSWGTTSVSRFGRTSISTGRKPPGSPSNW